MPTSRRDFLKTTAAVGGDNSGSRVEFTTASAELLKDAADVYMYTSSTVHGHPGTIIATNGWVRCRDMPGNARKNG